MDRLLQAQQLEYIASIRGALDLIHSVSTLPEGWLWGGRLNSAQVCKNYLLNIIII